MCHLLSQRFCHRLNRLYCRPSRLLIIFRLRRYSHPRAPLRRPRRYSYSRALHSRSRRYFYSCERFSRLPTIKRVNDEKWTPLARRSTIRCCSYRQALHFAIDTSERCPTVVATVNAASPVFTLECQICAVITAARTYTKRRFASFFLNRSKI